MHELDLPRRYRTIIVCGGFGIGGHRKHDMEGLRRLGEHLEPAAPSSSTVCPRYADPTWRLWRKEERAELLRPWRIRATGAPFADGSELELRGRLVEVDPLEQCVTREIHALLWQDGEVVTEEKHVLKEMFYFTHELVLELEADRLQRSRRSRRHEDRTPTADDDFVVFIARK